MSVIAVYNMKGGVGKTTSAVNLAYLSAAAGRRTLLWDLDPQAAASFAFRVRPRVAGFGRKHLQHAGALAASIKATDFDHLDLLPADFAYRKLDRLLDHGSRPERVVAALLEGFDREYDTVLLDCPAGFSLMTEGILASAHLVLVPTIPTVFSLRTLVPLLAWADRSGSPAQLAAFFGMVDRRRAGHRRASTWPAEHPELFLSAQIPYASLVEQMAVRRMPLPVFAARDAATAAFAALWTELQGRLSRRGAAGHAARPRWKLLASTIESLLLRFDDSDRDEPAAAGTTPAGGEVDFVHTFDTEALDLSRAGYALELQERTGSWRVTLRAGDDHAGVDVTRRVSAPIDARTATRVLSGAWSPLEALEHGLRGPVPPVLGAVRALVAGWKLRRVESRAGGPAPRTEAHESREPGTPAVNDWMA